MQAEPKDIYKYTHKVRLSRERSSEHSFVINHQYSLLYNNHRNNSSDTFSSSFYVVAYECSYLIYSFVYNNPDLFDFYK